MWETICDAQAGFWLNSKFLSKFSTKPLSGISDQKDPPPTKMKNFRFEMTKVYSEIPPPNEKLQIWGDQSLLQNTPPPPRKLKFSHFLALWVFSVLAPPQKNSNLAISWHFEYFQFWHPTAQPPPPPQKGLQSGRSYVETNLYPPWIPLVDFSVKTFV